MSLPRLPPHESHGARPPSAAVPCPCTMHLHLARIVSAPGSPKRRRLARAGRSTLLRAEASARRHALAARRHLRRRRRLVGRDRRLCRRLQL
eukprot:5599567-Prymnesium_polylepis.1